MKEENDINKRKKIEYFPIFFQCSPTLHQSPNPTLRGGFIYTRIFPFASLESFGVSEWGLEFFYEISLTQILALLMPEKTPSVQQICK